MLLEALYRLNKANPDKSEILIKGYGRLNLDSTKRQVKKRLLQALENVEQDDDISWRNVQNILYSSGVLQAMVEAINEANEDIENVLNIGTTEKES